MNRMTERKTERERYKNITERNTLRTKEIAIVSENCSSGESNCGKYLSSKFYFRVGVDRGPTRCELARRGPATQSCHPIVRRVVGYSNSTLSA